MPPVGFETTISAGERPQNHALDGATTGTGKACIPSDICSEYVLPGLELCIYLWNLPYFARRILGCDAV